MQVKNIGQRGWVVGGKLIAPNKVEDVEVTEADIAGNDELVVVKAKEEDKPEDDKGMTKAEIAAALKEKGIEFDASAKKADLQELLEKAE